MSLEQLKDKLEEIESQIGVLSSQKENVVNAINVEIANKNIGDVLYDLYFNCDEKIYLVYTDVKDICMTTKGQGVIYNALEIRVDIGDSVHMRQVQKIYVNHDEFCEYNTLINKDELLEMPKIVNVIKGVVLMNQIYQIA